MTQEQEYRYALSITSQFYFCGIPFRLDVSPKCTLNCLYCFAMSRGGRKTSRKLIANSARISRKIERAIKRNSTRQDVNGEMLTHRVPIHFGGISDPFSNQRTSAVTRELLDTLRLYDYPVVISTKNTQELLRDETLELLRKLKHVAVQVSFSTSNDRLAKAIEPNAPCPRQRLRCLRILSEEGIHTIARLQPLIYPWIDEVVHDLISALGAAACKHVIVEYLKLPVERNVSLISGMLEAIDWNAYEFYKRNGAALVGREWLLPGVFKWEHLQPVVDAIHQCGMTYGAGDHELYHLGDTNCCCGVDELDGFSNWFRGNYSNVIRQSHSDYVLFSDVTKHWVPQRSIARYMNSNCRLQEGNAVPDYLRSKWNSPGTANAPDAYLGISWHGDYDRDGNCVYRREQALQ